MERTAYGSDPKHPAPVLSVSLLDRATLGQNGEITPRSRIMIGVRRAETNPTHPEVVSIPTMRVPEGLLDGFYGPAGDTGRETIILPVLTSEIEEVRLGKDHRVTPETTSHDPIKYVVEAILSRKLLLGKALEEKELTFTAEPAVAITGSVLYETTGEKLPGREVEVGGQAYFKEQITMYNVSVVVSDAKLFPAETPSYGDIRWAGVKEYLEMVETKNPSILSALFGKESIQYCVHGLCLASAYLDLKKREL